MTDIRDTQSLVKVLSDNTPAILNTQVQTKVLSANTPTIRETQALVKVVSKNTPIIRHTQAMVKVVGANTPIIRLTQVLLKTLHSVAVLYVPPPVGLVLTTFAPVVSTPRLVTPTTLSLVLTTFAPVVSNPVVVTPTTLSLVLTTFAPVVTASTTPAGEPVCLTWTERDAHFQGICSNPLTADLNVNFTHETCVACVLPEQPGTSTFVRCSGGAFVAWNHLLQTWQVLSSTCSTGCSPAIPVEDGFPYEVRVVECQ